MLVALPLALAVVAVLVFRHASTGNDRRALWLVAGLALALRLGASVVIFLIARQAHDSGEWLNDESAFFKATQSLLPNPLDRPIQGGLEHLGGDGYLGLTTVLSLAGGGVADTNVFRVVNAALGTIVVVLGMLVARRLFGSRAALVGGLLLAVWPTLILWSATMLRDTLGSFTVVALWWTLARARELGWFRTVGALFLALVLLLSLRPYLGAAAFMGVAAWAVFPWLQRLGARRLAFGAAGLTIIVASFGVLEARNIDYAIHQLLYRRTMTRMETLGRLYTDYPPLRPDVPFRPGTAVGLIDPGSGWVLGGVVQDFDAPGIARVAFTDESIREVPAADLIPIESTSIPPSQFVGWIGPDLLNYLTGASTTPSDPTSPIWIAVALTWDALLIVAVVGVARLRLPVREWLFGLFVVGGTVTALITIPGAPGNADRHRATQTVPLLLVLASGFLSARAVSGRAVSSITMSPPSAAAAASSRIRSAR